MVTNKSFLLVGGGLFNSVLARKLVLDGEKVIILEKEKELGGQLRDYFDKKAKCWTNLFGCHIFHFDNNSKEAENFIRNYGNFCSYKHTVSCAGNGKIIYWPLNDASNKLYNFLGDNQNAYEEFVASYSKKMWGKHWDEIKDDVLARFKMKDSITNNFFGTEESYILLDGFNNMISKLTRKVTKKYNQKITFRDLKDKMNNYEKIVVTSPIDEFFNYKFGRLDWTGIKFDFEYIDSDGDLLPTPVVNLNMHPTLLRVVEYSQFSFETCKTKLLVKETPSDKFKFYPINTQRNKDILLRYQTFAKNFPNIIFAGRLGTYSYNDMDTTILEALKLFKQIKNEK